MRRVNKDGNKPNIKTKEGKEPSTEAMNRTHEKERREKETSRKGGKSSEGVEYSTNTTRMIAIVRPHHAPKGHNALSSGLARESRRKAELRGVGTEFCLELVAVLLIPFTW